MPLSQTTLHLADEDATTRLGAALAQAIEHQRAAISARGAPCLTTPDSARSPSASASASA
jgi:hypothetical protein